MFVSGRKYEILKNNYKLLNDQRKEVEQYWRDCQKKLQEKEQELKECKQKLEKYERTRKRNCIKCGKEFEMQVNSRRTVCDDCRKPRKRGKE